MRVVAMAVVSALQNEMMMNEGIETTNNTAITLATQIEDIQYKN